MDPDTFRMHCGRLFDRLVKTIDEYGDTIAAPDDDKISDIEGAVLIRMVTALCDANGFDAALARFTQACRDTKRDHDQLSQMSAGTLQ
jgi:hypothetical protein